MIISNRARRVSIFDLLPTLVEMYELFKSWFFSGECMKS